MTDLDLSADDIRRALDDLAGTVRPSVDEAWAQLLPRLSTVATDVVGGDGGDGGHPTLDPDTTVVELSAHVPRRRRYRSSALGAVAAAVLLAGLAVVVPRLGGGDIAADRAVPWFLLPSSETRLRVQQAELSPPTDAAGHTIVLADEGVTRGYVVTAHPAVGQEAFTAPSGGAVDAVTVHGEPAQLLGGTLWWNEAGTALNVASLMAPVDRVELLAVAEGLKLAGDGTPSATVVPAGLAVRVDGPDTTVVPDTRYRIDYTAEDLDAPSDDYLQLTVSEGGDLDVVRASLAVFAPGPARVEDVRGHPATVRSGTSDGLTGVALAWEERPGVTVGVLAYGLTEAEVLALARGLRAVDEDAWRDAAGPTLVDGGGGESSAATTAATVPPTVVARGDADGVPWSLRLDNPGTGTGLVCLTLDAGSLIAGGCAERAGRISVVGVSAVADGPAGASVWITALVADDVARVEVLDVAGTVVARADRVDADVIGGVVVVRDAGATGVSIVGYDAAGARLVSQALISTETGAPLPAATFPDVEALGGLPVLATGTLEDRPWRLRAGRVRLVQAQADGTQAPTGETAACASVDFAQRTQLAVTCENDRAGVPGVVSIGAATSPRTFLTMITEPGIDRITVGWADGTTTEVAVARIDGDDRGAAAVAVPRGSRVVSLATSAGRAEVDVSGEADSSPTLPASGRVSGP